MYTLQNHVNHKSLNKMKNGYYPDSCSGNPWDQHIKINPNSIYIQNGNCICSFSSIFTCGSIIGIKNIKDKYSKFWHSQTFAKFLKCNGLNCFNLQFNEGATFDSFKMSFECVWQYGEDSNFEQIETSQDLELVINNNNNNIKQKKKMQSKKKMWLYLIGIEGIDRQYSHIYIKVPTQLCELLKILPDSDKDSSLLIHTDFSLGDSDAALSKCIQITTPDDTKFKDALGKHCITKWIYKISFSLINYDSNINNNDNNTKLKETKQSPTELAFNKKFMKYINKKKSNLSLQHVEPKFKICDIGLTLWSGNHDDNNNNNIEFHSINNNNNNNDVDVVGFPFIIIDIAEIPTNKIYQSSSRIKKNKKNNKNKNNHIIPSSDDEDEDEDDDEEMDDEDEDHDDYDYYSQYENADEYAKKEKEIKNICYKIVNKLQEKKWIPIYLVRYIPLRKEETMLNYSHWDEWMLESQIWQLSENQLKQHGLEISLKYGTYSQPDDNNNNNNNNNN